jgi:uncharacterized glyoxalase superfamily protein PhnB
MMLKNRSVPPCTVIPVLYYPNPSEAAEWLGKAFGFKVRLRIGKNHRIQMKAGDGCLVVAEGTLPALKTGAKVAGGHAVMVRVADALAHCERARAAGARILSEPVEHMYGERQYNAEDPFGHRWDFTQTLKDVAPQDWGGEPVELE